jgi:hypothetical protein
LWGECHGEDLDAGVKRVTIWNSDFGVSPFAD